MVAPRSPKKPQVKEERERLRGEGNQMKFVDIEFES